MADENAWKLAQICREALNQDIYGGEAPNDSGALSEVWPTASGAAFTIPRDDREYAVIIVPVSAAAEDMIHPDYGPPAEG